MVKDNGPELEGDMEEIQKDTMGLQLINILTEQLQGKVTVNVHNGTEFKIVFPLEKET